MNKPRCIFALEMYRNRLCRRFEWCDGYMLDCATNEITPMTWESWEMLPYDLKQQGFKPCPQL